MAKIEQRIKELEKTSWLKQGKDVICVCYVEARDGEALPPGELLGYDIHGGDYVERKAGESDGAVYKRAVKAALASVKETSRYALLREDRAPHGASLKFKISPLEAYKQMLSG